MKRIFVAVAFYFAAFAAPACAQPMNPDPAAPSLYGVYYEQWTPQQWQALQQQLTTSLRVPVQAIDQNVLRNVIYFETHFPDAMDLERTAPRLLRIYLRHPEASIRLLAISALHAVSEPETMERLSQIIRHEESELTRHVGTAAVADFYRTREKR